MLNVFFSPWQALRDGFLASVAIVTLSAVVAPIAVGPDRSVRHNRWRQSTASVCSHRRAGRGDRHTDLFDSELVRGRLVEGLPDTANVEQALAELLDGTGLELVRISEDRFRIVPAGTARTLDRMVVTGTRLARANALNRKRAATNIAEYAIADDVNKLPDTNLADAVSRLPGVSVQGSLGEGQFVSIRGLSPALNQLNVNGQTSAISDVDGRQGRLDRSMLSAPETSPRSKLPRH